MNAVVHADTIRIDNFVTAILIAIFVVRAVLDHAPDEQAELLHRVISMASLSPDFRTTRRVKLHVELEAPVTIFVATLARIIVPPIAIITFIITVFQAVLGVELNLAYGSRHDPDLFVVDSALVSIKVLTVDETSRWGIAERR